MKRRDFLFLLGATAAGCSRSASDGRTTIHYMAWGNPEQLAVERQIADDFERQHPHIRVHLFMVPGSAYADKLQLMLASRTAPDVMRVDHYFFPALVRKGYFLPFDSFLSGEPGAFLEDFVPVALQEGRWNDRLYGMNVLFGSVMIYYNKKLFREAGLPDPYEESRKGRWTWDRFVEAAAALTRREPGSDRPVQFGTNMVDFPLYAPVIWDFGGALMDSNLTHMTAAQDPQAIAGMQAYADLRWKHRCAPTPADNALSPFTFESGRVAMIWGWAGESPRYRKNIKDFDWDIVLTPTGPRSDATVVKGNQLVISNETEHPQESWEFVKFMTGPEAELLLCGKLRRAVPTRRSVQNNPGYLKADQPPFHTDVFLESVRRGRILPIDWRYQEWLQEFRSATDPLFSIGDVTAATALQDAEQRVNRVLSGEEGF